MNTRVAGLYVHGPRGTRPEDADTTPMLTVSSVEAVDGMGLREDSRYFRKPPDDHERKRQVSLIDEGTIRRLESQLSPMPRELIKAQIILEGEILLPALVGHSLVFPSGAVLTVAVERKPCFAMDLIAPGLREAMQNSQQGALARVTVSGFISLGDEIAISEPEPAQAGAFLD